MLTTSAPRASCSVFAGVFGADFLPRRVLVLVVVETFGLVAAVFRVLVFMLRFLAASFTGVEVLVAFLAVVFGVVAFRDFVVVDDDRVVLVFT